MSRLLCATLVLFVWNLAAYGAEPGLTIYNQDFAVVRDTVRLELQPGRNTVNYDAQTPYLEPQSVILRDPSGNASFRIIEQNYLYDTLTQGALLARYEGQTIQVLVRESSGPSRIEDMRILRAGTPPTGGSAQYYGRGRDTYGDSGQSIVEIDGQIQFGLPGTPLFPGLGPDALLQPALEWIIESQKAAVIDAELSFVTRGTDWRADYNLVSVESGETANLTGWVTLSNNSGTTYENAHVKLMAGDVSKLAEGGMSVNAVGSFGGAYGVGGMAAPAVTERTFDEYHLYTLEAPTTLRNGESKQVEFLRAPQVRSQQFYLYSGVNLSDQDYHSTSDGLIYDPQYGTRGETKVRVMREFENTPENGLGMPLPKGRLRFYRADGANIEFTGENVIDHTPAGETIRVYTGCAFDLVGERRQTEYQREIVDASPLAQQVITESFEIKLRSAKKEAVEVRVVEPLYRGTNWEILEASSAQTKLDSSTIEFRMTVEPGEEHTLTYKVRYTSWSM